MEDIKPTQEANIETKNNGLSSEKQVHNQDVVEPKGLNHRTKTWLIVGGVITSIVLVATVVFAILAASGVFDDDNGPCPAGKYRVCGPLGDGEDACGCYSNPDVDLKPIIYLYPESEINVTVRLGAPEKLTASYPKYIDGWDVTAYPNGDLIDRSNGNKIYSLYWEGIRDTSKLDLTTGFVVKSEDVASFLEEKLSILGLNYREKEEFIVYWLSKLEASKYNYIYFATAEEIDEEMPLEFSIQPDTVIRVRMIFKGLDEYKEVKEQILTPAPERKGFTVVEWGGTDLTKQNN